MRERRMLMPNLGIFLLACYCCCKFLLAAAPAPAFLTFGENFEWDVRDQRYILQSESVSPAFACGFNWTGTPYHFSIFIYADEPVDPQVVWTANRDKPSDNSSDEPVDPQVVWTANRDKPLDDSSALRLAQDGNLELVDGHGSVVWSTGTSGMPVTAMKLEETGNLVLLDADNRTLWQSFDFPADTLVAGQNLQSGKRLTSFPNSTGASYFVLAKDGDLRAFIDAKPPQMYLQLKDFRKYVRECRNYTTFKSTIYEKLLDFTRVDCNKTTPLQFVITASISGNTTRTLTKSPNHFMKLESDGRLTIYDWDANGNAWVSYGFGNVDLDQCLYPVKCGAFCVCKDGQCSCPTTPEGETKYFKHLNEQLPDKGCEEVGAIPSCKEPNNWRLVDFGNYSYFAFVDPNAAAGNITNLNACREACLNNCSCQAMFYNSQNENTTGNCYLLDQVFSIRVQPLYGETYISRAFFKVSNQSSPSPAPAQLQDGRKYKDSKYIVGIAVGSLAVTVVVVGTILFLVRKKREEEGDEEEDELEHVPGMVPRRFSYEELKTATEDFQTILGQGGFGSVFIGFMNDGTRIAVKRLHNIGQGMEFVAEVQTIGSIHHLNLVRLVGFCARKSHRLLVYEYMSIGSLDRWIFHENENPNLDWKTRQNIIIGTSKGLCYLHEECSQRIAHLDIKPQNILLDESFNAKISDFGLSKLISRDESQVVTTMRGTPGYLAPEWLNASISEKADVYSFGVVVMEVVCGRRNLDLSRPEGSRYLLKLLQSSTQENQLLGLVDMTDEERSCFGVEAVRVMRIAMWCLQNDHTLRPPMSSVVKAFEGTMELDGHTEFGPVQAVVPGFASQTESETQSLLLSGPR